MRSIATKIAIALPLLLGPCPWIAMGQELDRIVEEQRPDPRPFFGHMSRLLGERSSESLMACTIQTLTIGRTASGQLDRTDCALTSAYADFWVFAGTAGQRVTVTYTSSALSPLLGTIQDGSSGEVLTGDSGPSPLVYSYVLPQTANFAVGLTSLKEGFATGSYTLLVTAETGGGGGTPNLVPFTPSGWSSPIVVSTISGTHTDASSISTNDSVFVDYAIRNLNPGDISATFANDLYLDGTRIRQGTTQGLSADRFSALEDYAIGHLTAGTHTLRLRADANDDVSESSESDNEFVKSFTVRSGGGIGCTPAPNSLCLSGGRFRATAHYRNRSSDGEGSAVPLSDSTGLFTFDNPDSVEVVVKVLNACSFTPNIWVFAGGLTNQEVTLTITDTRTGASKTYFNPLEQTYSTITDTSAFSTCP